MQVQINEGQAIEKRPTKIPEGARRTSTKLCKSCRYSGKLSTTQICCEYILIEKKRRGCPLGWCDKYQPIKKGKK